MHDIALIEDHLSQNWAYFVHIQNYYISKSISTINIQKNIFEI